VFLKVCKKIQTYIADCDLRIKPQNTTGHTHSYYSSFSKLPKSVGYLCHKSFQYNSNSLQYVFRRSRVEIFSKSITSHSLRLDFFIKSIWMNLSYLSALFKAKIESPSIILHVNSAEYNLIAIYIFSIFKNESWQFAYLQTEPRKFQSILWRIINFLPGRRLLAVCEVKKQSNQYSKRIKRTVHLLPSVINSKIFQDKKTRIGRLNGHRLRGCFLGDSRLEKGYDLITQWLPRSSNDFIFEIQARPIVSTIDRDEDILSLCSCSPSGGFCNHTLQAR
jgi:hypothetical protein